eukprot:jgi/Ulvmu1/7105/UM034_0011.1
MRAGNEHNLCARILISSLLYVAFALPCVVNALQVLPPIEHPDRASAASGSSVQTDLYNDPQWVKSWYGPVPEQIRTSERDQGFNFTKSMTKVQVAYAVDKILRNSANTDRKQQVVADLGCGGGYITTEVALVPGWSVIAIDQAKASLDVARAAFKRLAHKHPTANATFLHAPIDRLPLADASVDAVLLFSVLEEMPDLRAAFREVRRVLRPDGIVVFGTRNRSVRSWLSLMWHTELLRDVPPALYDWRLGVQPVEVKRLAAEEGFNMVHEELQGMCEVGRWEWRWGEWPWVLQQRDVEFRECSDDTRYLGWAYAVQRSTHSTFGGDDGDLLGAAADGGGDATAADAEDDIQQEL